MIYWLYHQQRAIFATIAPDEATDAEVRERALWQHALVPLCHPNHDAKDFAALLRTANVYRD